VDGHLDDHWSAWLGEIDLGHDSDGTTTANVTVADQAQLHGILAGLRDIGAVLLELRATGPEFHVYRPALDHPLRTERLTLRPATEDDTEPTWRFRRLEEVNEWLTGGPADLEGYRAKFCDPARLAASLVITLGGDTGPVIGDLMLRREDAWAQAEITDQAEDVQAELGWVLDPAYTGHGYATEAVRELIRFSFEDLGLRRVTAQAFLDNEASWRLMERVGMRRESHGVRDSLHRSGRWLDSVAYAILDDEWPAAEPPRG
jgi:RimJ/RimL family protein N-acetyltransferase